MLANWLSTPISPINVAAQSPSADVVSLSGQATVEGNVEYFRSMLPLTRGDVKSI